MTEFSESKLYRAMATGTIISVLLDTLSVPNKLLLELSDSIETIVKSNRIAKDGWSMYRLPVAMHNPTSIAADVYRLIKAESGYINYYGNAFEGLYEYRAPTHLEPTPDGYDYFTGGIEGYDPLDPMVAVMQLVHRNTLFGFRIALEVEFGIKQYYCFRDDTLLHLRYGRASAHNYFNLVSRLYGDSRVSENLNAFQLKEFNNYRQQRTK